jgi:hypothetical protein
VRSGSAGRTETGVTTPISGCATAIRRPFIPDTKERTGDLLSIPENAVATAARLSDDGLQLDWQDGAVSRFDLDWLEGHGPGRPTFDPADLPHETWRADFDVPRHDADAIARNEAALRDWIRDTVVCGLTIVEGVATEPGAGLALARRIGFPRRPISAKTSMW